jgi:hypothetical protein
MPSDASAILPTVDRDFTSAGDVQQGLGVSSGAARLIQRERQKRQLRRERDTLVLSIAREHGEQGLAQQLGLTPTVAGKLLAGARERLASGSPEILARRLGADRDRFAAADAHFASLGEAPPLFDRRQR